MLIYIQWTRAVPQDWEAIEITRLQDWRQLPFKDVPTSGLTGTVDVDLGPQWGIQTILDENHVTANDPGWIYDMSVAGISMSGADHISVNRDGPRMALTRWNDDVEWVGDRYAQQWSFSLPVTDTETGRLEPDVQLTIWAESQARRDAYTGRTIGRPPALYDVNVFDWNQWIEPNPANIRRHGIWMTDAQVAAHESAKTFVPDFPGWSSLTGA